MGFDGMKQTDLGLEPSTRRARKQILLEEMNQVIPWSDLLSLIAPDAPVAKTGRPPSDLALMLRIHCLQQWFGLSDLGAEEALFETSFYRDLAGISGTQRIPDRISILRFRHLLEEHALSPKILHVINAKWAAYGLLLKTDPVVNATVNAAPSSTKNKTSERYPEMHQVKISNQRHFGMSQFGYVKVRYRGLAKNIARLITLFAQSNIWMVRSRLMQRAQGRVRLEIGKRRQQA